MKIKIELETTEAETFSALEKLEYFGDRIREAAALFQGKIIESMEEGFEWPPPVTEPWPEKASDSLSSDEEWDGYEEEEEEDEEEADYDDVEEDEPVAKSKRDVEFPRPVDLDALAAANTAPIWSTLSLSAASSAYEVEEKEEATPQYLKQEKKASTPAVNTSGLSLPQLSDEVRRESTEAFFDLVQLWMENFDAEGPQPDRLEALRKLGSGRFALSILVMCFELGSLQRLVEKALIVRHLCEQEHSGHTETEQAVLRQNRLELADRISANMVQISHLVYPDLAGTYDYSTKWRRG
jgi:hypothetical protein